MLKFKDCLDLIEKKIALIPEYREPVELFEPIRYTLSMGGKRIRPCLSLLAHQLYSDNMEPVINPALGAEVFHNFTLLHDDIMDYASMRRNLETVHVKWNTNVAILSGDAMMILAYHLISKTNKEILLPILNVFNRTALEVCEGQQMDMNFESRKDVSKKEYLEMIRLKTAVLLAACLAIGGITGKAPEEDINNLYQLGINIGLAFQLQDDWLDVYADSKKFGKQIGNDIISNKKTFLLISAMNSKDKELTDEINHWLSIEKYDPVEKVNSVRKIYEAINLDKETTDLAQKYFNEGLNFLEKINVNTERKKELKDLIVSLMQRER
jgi:geranylgeranyl diphosphate synthase type II